MTEECKVCGIQNDIIPVEIVYYMCKKCMRTQCFEYIQQGLFQTVIENNIKKAQTMLQVTKEFQERNEYEYNQLPEKIKTMFEQYLKLLFWD